jgi:hypothetical protein
MYPKSIEIGNEHKSLFLFLTPLFPNLFCVLYKEVQLWCKVPYVQPTSPTLTNNTGRVVQRPNSYLRNFRHSPVNSSLWGW